MPARWVRWSVVATVAACVLSTVAAVAGPASDPKRDPALDMLMQILTERRARGVRPLRLDADLRRVAQAHAERMARARRVWHNREAPGEVRRRRVILGENVGTGVTPAALHESFMRSRSHRDVLLDARFSRIGVGVVRKGSLLYVSVLFGSRPRGPAKPAGVVRHARPAPAPVRPAEDPARAQVASGTVRSLLRLAAFDR